jgi:hypothetical protein
MSTLAELQGLNAPLQSLLLLSVNWEVSLTLSTLAFVIMLLAVFRGGRTGRSVAFVCLLAAAVESIGMRHGLYGKPDSRWYVVVQVALALGLVWQAWRYRERWVWLIAGLQTGRLCADLDCVFLAHRLPWLTVIDLGVIAATAALLGRALARDWLAPPRLTPVCAISDADLLMTSGRRLSQRAEDRTR